MSIAETVREFLDCQGLRYEVLQHPHTSSSAETANAAYVWEDQLAKSVVLADERGYVIAVLPASYRVDLKKLRRATRRQLRLADESELASIFSDCEPGAVPPVGRAYGIPVVYDDQIQQLGSVYFEGGDHEDLVYMGGAEFMQLLAGTPHCRFAKPM